MPPSPVTKWYPLAVPTQANLSPDQHALDPVAVVTVMSATPAPGGGTAVISVSESTVQEAADVEPKSTAVAPVKPRPLMVTEVRPLSTPVDGATETTAGPATICVVARSVGL